MPDQQLVIITTALFHLSVSQGTFAGILIGLAQLNCSELKLKRLCCRHGYEYIRFNREPVKCVTFVFVSVNRLSRGTTSSLLGVDKVIQFAVTEWLTDIRKNQLPGILGGVGPMHSVVQLCELILLMSAVNTILNIASCHLISRFISCPLPTCSPWSEGSVLVTNRAVQERWTYYPRPAEGGGILRHLHGIGCSGAQQQAGASHTGTCLHALINSTCRSVRACFSQFLFGPFTGYGGDGVRHPFPNAAVESICHN